MIKVILTTAIQLSSALALTHCQRAGNLNVDNGSFGTMALPLDGNNQDGVPDLPFSKEIVVKVIDNISGTPVEGMTVQFVEVTSTGARILTPGESVVTDAAGVAKTFVKAPKKYGQVVKIEARVLGTNAKAEFVLKTFAPSSCVKIEASSTHGDVEIAGNAFGFNLQCVDVSGAVDKSYNEELELIYNFVTSKSWGGDAATYEGGPLPEAFTLKCQFVNGECSTRDSFVLTDSREISKYWIGDGPGGLADVFAREITLVKNQPKRILFADGLGGDMGLDGLPNTGDERIALFKDVLDYDADMPTQVFFAVATDKAGNFIRDLDSSEAEWSTSGVTTADPGVDPTLVLGTDFVGFGNPKSFTPNKTGAGYVFVKSPGLSTLMRSIRVYRGEARDLEITPSLSASSVVAGNPQAGYPYYLFVNVVDSKGNLIKAKADGTGSYTGNFGAIVYTENSDTTPSKVHGGSHGCATGEWGGVKPATHCIDKSLPVSIDGMGVPPAFNQMNGAIYYLDGVPQAVLTLTFNEAGAAVSPKVTIDIAATSLFPGLKKTVGPFTVDIGSPDHVMVYKNDLQDGTEYMCTLDLINRADAVTPCMRATAGDPDMRLYAGLADKGGNYLMPVDILWTGVNNMANDILPTDSSGTPLAKNIPSHYGVYKPRVSGSGGIQPTTVGGAYDNVAWTLIGGYTALNDIDHFEISVDDGLSTINTLSAVRSFKMKIVARDITQNLVPVSGNLDIVFSSSGATLSPKGTAPILPTGTQSIQFIAGEAEITGFRIPNASDSGLVSLQVTQSGTTVSSDVLKPTILAGPTSILQVRTAVGATGGSDVTGTTINLTADDIVTYYGAIFDDELNFKGNPSMTWSGTITAGNWRLRAAYEPVPAGPSATLGLHEKSPIGSPWTLTANYTEDTTPYQATVNLNVRPGELRVVDVESETARAAFYGNDPDPGEVAGVPFTAHITLEDNWENKLEFTGDKNVDLFVVNNSATPFYAMDQLSVPSLNATHLMHFVDGELDQSTTPWTVTLYNAAATPRIRAQVDGMTGGSPRVVHPAVLDHFRITPSEANVVAGDGSAPESVAHLNIVALDRYGNTQTESPNNSMSVSYSFQSALGGQDIKSTNLVGAASMSGNSDASADGNLINGAALVTVTATQAGVLTGKVTTTVTPAPAHVKPDVFTSVIVDPDPVIDHLGWNPAPPASSYASAFSPISTFKVAIYDKYNNIITTTPSTTNTSSTVTLSVDAPANAAYLGGNKTPAVSSGQASFGDITYSNIETIRLRAHESVSGLEIYKDVNIVQGAATHAVVVINQGTEQSFNPGVADVNSVVTGSVSAKSADSSSMNVRIYALDDGNNVVTSYNGALKPRVVQASDGTTIDDAYATIAPSAGGSTYTNGDVNASFIAFINGVADLTITVRKAGSFKIKPNVSFTGDLPSSSFTITPGVKNQIVLTLPGQSLVPGATSYATAISGTASPQLATATNFTLTANATDQYYNLITDSATNVTIGFQDADPRRTVDSVVAASGTKALGSGGTPGVATFQLKYFKALAATKVTTSSATGYGTLRSSTGFDTLAGTPTQTIVVVKPGQTFVPGVATYAEAVTGTPTARAAGTSFTAEVYAVDANFNQASYSGSVSLGVASDLDVNIAPATSQSFVNGYAAFTITDYKAATHLIAQTSSLATNNTPATYDVIPGTAAKTVVLDSATQTLSQGRVLVSNAITGTPSARTAGTAINFNIYLTDTWHNVVSSSGTFTFAVNDSKISAPAATPFTAGNLSGVSVTVKEARLDFHLTATSGVTGVSSNIVVNHAAAAKLSYATPPANPTVAGANMPIQVKVLDTYDNLVTSGADAGATITLSLTSGTGPLYGTLSKVAAGGIANLSANGLNIQKADAYVLHAAKNDLSGSGGVGPLSVDSSSFNVKASTATNFVVTSSGTTNAGDWVDITVKALDSYSNTATGFTGTVLFTSSDSVADKPNSGSYTFVGGDAGIHTFSSTSGLRFHTVGTQSITATQSGSPGVNGSLGNIVVGPGPHAKFLLTASATATAGTAVAALQVTAADVYGNTTPSYTGTIQFSTPGDSNSPVLPGDYTFVAGDNGIKTFNSQLIFHTSGTQTIKAADSVDPTNKYGTVNVSVSPSSAYELVNASAPASGTVNSVISPTIQVVDQYGNGVGNFSLKFTIQLAATGGTVNSASTATISSSSTTGYATPSWKLGSVAGSANNSLKVETGGAALPGPNPEYYFYVDGLAGALHHFDITGLPASITAGTASDVTVTAHDQYNNLVSWSGAVTFTSTDPTPALLPTSVSLLNGTGTFTNGVTFKKAGARTVTVTGGGKTGTSPSVTVNPSSPDHLTIVQNGSTTAAGGTVSPAVKVRVVDVYGNGTPTQAIPGVSWTIAAGGGTATPGSSTTDANGDLTSAWVVGTDSSVTNQLSLATTLGGSPSTVTLSASVTAASPAQLEWTQQPPAVVYQGQVFSPSVKVQLKDSYGNLSSAAKTIVLKAYTDAGCSTPAAAMSGASVTSSSGLATFSAASYGGASSVYIQGDGSSAGIAGTTSCVPVTVYPTLTVTPSSLASISGGSSQAFVAGGGNPAYTWSYAGVSGGSVDAAGNYTAGTTACGTDRVTVTDSGGSAQQHVDIDIAVGNIAKLAFTPWGAVSSSSYDFGTTSVTSSQIFKVKNTGCATSGALATVSLINATDPAAFSFTGTDFCSGQTLSAAGTCSVSVQFNPAAVASGTYNVDILFTIGSGTGTGSSFTQHVQATK